MVVNSKWDMQPTNMWTEFEKVILLLVTITNQGWRLNVARDKKSHDFTRQKWLCRHCYQHALSGVRAAQMGSAGIVGQ